MQENLSKENFGIFRQVAKAMERTATEATFDMTESWMKKYPLQDPADMNALLETADLTRQLINGRNYAGIDAVIVFTIENGLYECLSWVLSLLQEEFEKQADYVLEDFVCDIGRSIANYDIFAESLQVDFNSQGQGLEKVYDEHGEAESFFNNFTYRTRYKNICLLTSENFDTKDNDYIQYRLQFSR